MRFLVHLPSPYSLNVERPGKSYGLGESVKPADGTTRCPIHPHGHLGTSRLRSSYQKRYNTSSSALCEEDHSKSADGHEAASASPTNGSGLQPSSRNWRASTTGVRLLVLGLVFCS